MVLERRTSIATCAAVWLGSQAVVAAAVAQNAETGTAAAAVCPGGAAIEGEVANVLTAKSFRLADGREVVLAGIEILSPDPAAGDGPRAEAVSAAREALASLVEHQSVVIRPAGTGPDRYGRIVGFVIRKAKSGDMLVQRELLSLGHALLSPTGTAGPCRTMLQSAEREARAAGIGLWGDPYYVVMEADGIEDVLAEQGRFTLVRGKVVSVRESGAVVYVSFGRRWSQDFTVTILKRNERFFESAGMPPNRLAGRFVEVRGWVEEHGGPAIEATRPEQIELLAGN